MSILLKKQTRDTRREALTISYKPLNRSLWLNTTNNTNVEAVLSADNRLTLALRWLRIAYRARSSVEQFNNYWLALEAYTPSHQVERKCPHCNGDLASYETTDIPKIKEYLRHYNADLTAAQANQIVRLRHKLFHGGAGFSLASSNEAGKWRKIVKNTIEQLLKQDTGITPLDLNEPNTPDEKARIFSGVAFNTSTPTEDFAFDYPTEQHILAESQNTNTLDETGMEFLSTDDDFINTF
jgi:hypothetical protein